MQKGREDSISITRLLLVVSLGPIYLKMSATKQKY